MQQSLLMGVATISAGCAAHADTGGGGGGGAPKPPRVVSAPASARRGGLWEATLTLDPALDNPFDPEEVAVSATLRGPGGHSLTIPAFYYQAYVRSLGADGVQALAAGGPPEWRVRFAPPQTGVWRYTWSYRYRNGRSENLGQGHLDVSRGDGPGVVGVDPKAPRRFADRGTGAGYLPIGENMCWPAQGGTYDYDRWLAKLSAVGGNYIRIWVNEGRFTLGFEQQPPVGNYRGGMQHAWELDYVLDACARQGVRAVLCLLWHGAFSTRVNPDWTNNPYNVTNGGPCGTPMDFFTDPVAKALFRRRLQYMVARWSAYASVLAWELWNEVNWVDGYAPEPVEAWHREMSQYLQTIDPNRHMVSTSYSGTTGDPAVWSLPTIDYVQMHDYHFPTVAERLARVIAGGRKYAKPVVFGEFGIDWHSGADEVRLDPHGHSLHDALWAAVFAGGAGTAMTWWWDSYVDPLDLYPVFFGLARVADDVGLAAMHPVPLSSGTGVRADAQTAVWGLQDAATSRVALWIKDLSASWQIAAVPPATGRTVTMIGLRSGMPVARWLNTTTGAAMEGPTNAVRSPNGWTLTVPTFSRDIAVLLQFA